MCHFPAAVKREASVETGDTIAFLYDGVASIFAQRALQALFPFPKEPDDQLGEAALVLAQEQRRDDIGLHLHARRSARTIVTIRAGSAATLSALDAYITQMALACLEGGVKKVHAGLKAVRDGGPLSLLPRLHSVATPLPRQLVGAVIDHSPGARFLLGNSGVLPLGAKPYQVHFTTFEPCARLNMWGLGEDANLLGAAQATLPRLATENGRYLRFQVALGAPLIADAGDTKAANCTAWPACQSAVSEREPHTVAPSTRLSVRQVRLLGTVARNWKPGSVVDTAAQRVLLQSMQFTFADTDNGNLGVAQTGHILFCPALSERPGADDTDEPQISIEAVTRLPLADIEPAAEDDLPQAGRARDRNRASDGRLPDPDTPLILAMPLAPDGATPLALNLALSALETVGPDRSHEIALSLRATQEERGATGTAAGDAEASGEAPERRRVLIIEPSPFRIAAVDFDAITSLANTESNEVAVWNQSGEGGESWRVRDDKQRVDLIYPPQAVGEAMEKNRTGLADQPHDIRPGKPSAARFGSLTVMKVDPTYADTRFREPGWNLRRILGRTTQRAPGARVLDLRLELLYGLLARVRSDDVWITEIAAADRYAARFHPGGAPPGADGAGAEGAATPAGGRQAVAPAPRRRLARDGRGHLHDPHQGRRRHGRTGHGVALAGARRPSRRQRRPARRRHP